MVVLIILGAGYGHVDSVSGGYLGEETIFNKLAKLGDAIGDAIASKKSNIFTCASLA